MTAAVLNLSAQAPLDVYSSAPRMPMRRRPLSLGEFLDFAEEFIGDLPTRWPEMAEDERHVWHLWAIGEYVPPAGNLIGRAIARIGYRFQLHSDHALFERVRHALLTMQSEILIQVSKDEWSKAYLDPEFVAAARIGDAQRLAGKVVKVELSEL